MIRSPFPDVEIPDTSLTAFVLAGADGLGGKPAFIDAPSGRTLSYGQLAESVRAAAAGLAGRGFGKGDVFAHYAPNLPEYAVAFHAVATVGGVNTTANPLLTAGELAAQLSDCGARLLVTVPPLLEKAAAAAERAGVEEIFVYGEAAGATPFESLLQPGGRSPEVVSDAACARVEEDGSRRSSSLSRSRKTRPDAPAELEAVLLTHPATPSRPVLVPDRRPAMCESSPCRSGRSPGGVARFVAGRVAPYKKLRAVEIVEEIPKSPSGKVLRRVLIERERTAAMHGEDR